MRLYVTIQAVVGLLLLAIPMMRMIMKIMLQSWSQRGGGRCRVTNNRFYIDVDIGGGCGCSGSEEAYALIFGVAFRLGKLSSPSQAIIIVIAETAIRHQSQVARRDTLVPFITYLKLLGGQA